MLSGLVFSLIVFAPMMMGAALAVVARRISRAGGTLSEHSKQGSGGPGNTHDAHVAEPQSSSVIQRHSRVIFLAIIFFALAVGAALPSVTWPIHLTAANAFVWVETALVMAIMMGALIAFAALIGSRSLHLRQREGRLANDISHASGLATFASEGCIVLHNVPADGFYIDHVVVGQAAVFAIQTEWRRRPNPMSGVSARVSFDGSRLQFPDSLEVAPLERARRSGRWLADYLTCALGAPIKVVPVLALPGWDVVATADPSNADVVVNSGDDPAFVTSISCGIAIPHEVRALATAALRKRFVAMQLDHPLIDIRA